MCKWEAIAVRHYRDTSFSNPGLESTTVVQKCKVCGTIKSKGHYSMGYITLEELRGKEE